MDSRLQAADRIMGVFRGFDKVREVSLRGSLADGACDEFSDIDIGVDVSGHDNGTFMQNVIDTMGEKFDLYFHDWATSLLPEQYVVTFYLKELPLFWNVDFQCTATPHVESVDREAIRAQRDGVAGSLKVWVLDAKYLLRGKAGIDTQIRDYAARVLGEGSLPDVEPASLLKVVLDELCVRASGRHSEFFAECYRLYEERVMGQTGA